jgi:amino acid adenylation domain-containing protein
MRLQLPTDFPRTPDVGYVDGIYTFALPGLASVIVGRKLGSEFTVVRSLLLSTFTILLHRYTQQAEIPLTVSFSSALPHPEADREICANIVADLKVNELIQQINAQLYAHLPDARLAMQSDVQASTQPATELTIDTVSLGHRASRLPVAVTFIKDTVAIQIEPKPMVASVPAIAATFPQPDSELHLCLRQQIHECSATLSYNANLFEAATIHRLARHFQVLLDGLLACLTTADASDANRTIAQIPMLTPTEIQQQLVDWQSDTVNYPDRPLHQYIEAHAVQQPDAIAATFQTQSFTYTELNQRANQLAYELQQRGVGTGIPVAVCVSPSLDILVCLLGVFKAGGIYVPLDPTHPSERLAVMLEDTQPQVLLTQSPLLSSLPTTATPTICLDRDGSRLAALPTTPPGTAISLSQTAAIIYTSGTTGKPKGVMISQRNLMNYVLLASDRYRISAQDVMPAIARFTFSITFFELLLPLVAGGKLIILERDHVLDFKRFVQTLAQLTVLHTSPSLMRKLLGYIQAQNIDLSWFRGVRHASVGGDLADAALLERMTQVFKTAEIFVIYGCSEVSCMGCTYPVPRYDSLGQSRVGKPFNNVSVRLYDAQQNLVPIGVAGEIYFGGAGVTQGYLNRPDLTQEKFVEIDGQRFYRTGDLGRYDADGNLEILGRSDFQIKLRGIRIELGDIEAALRQAPGVRDGVVMARLLNHRATANQNGDRVTAQSAPEEKSLIAYVVLESRSDVAIVALRQFLQAKLPDYMVPAAFVPLDALPVNINLKVDRYALPEPSPENLAGCQPFVAPRDEYEQRLAKIWETLLGISSIGVQDNFFEVGGDSLQSATLMTQIEQEFGKALALSTLLTEPTIEQLAAVLKQTKQSDLHQSIVPLRKGGSKPPIFLIHDGEGETLLYRNLALRLHPEHPVYGIQPHSRDGYPILHTRIEEIVAYYVEKIQQVQPHGPYCLGGLCIGGFIAFEVARQLQNRQEAVAMVALIDTADLEAPLRRSQTTKRLNSLANALNSSKPRSRSQRLFTFANIIRKKATNVIAYEVKSKVAKMKTDRKIKLLRFYRDRQLPLPAFLKNISVRVTLKFAERSYVPEALYPGAVLLFRATQKSSAFDGTEIDDTPYSELYDAPLLGWERRTTSGVAGVRLYDTPGGHSSMLQEPNVQVIAAAMQTYIDHQIATYEYDAINLTVQAADCDRQLSHARTHG